jgi:hypothetical protein
MGIVKRGLKFGVEPEGKPLRVFCYADMGREFDGCRCPELSGGKAESVDTIR